MAAVYFDIERFNSPAFRKLEKQYEADATSYLVKLEMWLWGQPSLEFLQSDAETVAEILRISHVRFEHFVRDALEYGILNLYKSKFVYSPSLDEQWKGYQKRIGGLKGDRAEEIAKLHACDMQDTSRSQDMIRQDKVGNDKEGQDKERQHELQHSVMTAVGTAAPPPAPKEPPKSEARKLAETLTIDAFEEPKDQPWTRKNAFVCAGRRPLKKYPELWLSPEELTRTFEGWLEANIPPEQFKLAFGQAVSQAKTMAAKGLSFDLMNAPGWLQGFIFQGQTEQAIKNARLKKLTGTEAA